MIKQTATLTLNRYQLDTLIEACEDRIEHYAPSFDGLAPEEFVTTAQNRVRGTELARDIDWTIALWRILQEARGQLCFATSQAALRGIHSLPVNNVTRMTGSDHRRGAAS